MFNSKHYTFPNFVFHTEVASWQSNTNTTHHRSVEHFTSPLRAIHPASSFIISHLVHSPPVAKTVVQTVVASLYCDMWSWAKRAKLAAVCDLLISWTVWLRLPRCLARSEVPAPSQMAMNYSKAELVILSPNQQAAPWWEKAVSWL